MQARLPNDSDHRAKVKGRYGTRPADKARIGVSVGSPKSEGSKMLAIAEWCRKRFPETEVIVADTLQRHYLPGTVDEAWTVARAQGDEWLSRNAEALHCFTVTRWDSLLAHPAYAESLAALEWALTIRRTQEALHDMASGFSARFNVPMERCAAFLKEELAVMGFMMRDPAIDIYAGTIITPLFDALAPVLPAFADMQWLEVDFDRRKAAQINPGQKAA
jgi:hypothetical protein